MEVGRPADIYNATRRRILPGLHSALDAVIGGYALSDTPPEEYVATLHCSEPEAEALLASFGLDRNLTASLKVRLDGNVSDGSWVYRESLLASHQLHVTIHRAGGGIDTYAHWERSSIRHPYRHYLARGYSADKGVGVMRSALEEADRHGIAWSIDAPHRRRTWYISLLRTVSEPLADRVTDTRERFDGALTEETPGILQRAVSVLR